MGRKMNVDAILKLHPGNSGLLLEMKGHNLRNSRMINKFTVPEYARNEDGVCVKCVDCNKWMAHRDGFLGLLDGHWRCPGCGKKIGEMRVYNKIEKENEKWSKKWESDDDD